MYPSKPECCSTGLMEPSMSTISSEIERLYKIVSGIEARIYPPTPEKNTSLEREYSENNLVNIRNDISYLADKLTYINEGLVFIGK